MTRPRRSYHHRDAAPRRQYPERVLVGGVVANIDGVRRIDAGVAHEELDRGALAADAARNRLVNHLAMEHLQSRAIAHEVVEGFENRARVVGSRIAIVDRHREDFVLDDEAAIFRDRVGDELPHHLYVGGASPDTWRMMTDPVASDEFEAVGAREQQAVAKAEQSDQRIEVASADDGDGDLMWMARELGDRILGARNRH